MAWSVSVIDASPRQALCIAFAVCRLGADQPLQRSTRPTGRP